MTWSKNFGRTGDVRTHLYQGNRVAILEFPPFSLDVGFPELKSDSRKVTPLLLESFFAILLLASCTATACDTAVNSDDSVYVGPYATETEHQRNDRMAWWREARFGLFIHTLRFNIQFRRL